MELEKLRLIELFIKTCSIIEENKSKISTIKIEKEENGELSLYVTINDSYSKIMKLPMTKSFLDNFSFNLEDLS